MGGLRVLNDGFEAIKVSYKKMSPFYIPYSLTNMASAVLAMDLGWAGPSYSINTACASSNYSILNAANHIIKGDTDIMLCGGSDGMIIPSGIAGLIACNALSQRNSDPTKAARPWDADRDGFVMGEGAGVLLLEELEHAKKRGTNIYAEILGGSLTCDAYHITAPHPEGVGMVSCMEKALAQSGVAKEDVNYINAHAPSTRLGDLREYQAVIRCFGKNPELRMNSTKSLIGHLLGASSAAEAVATVKAIQTGWIHPNLNLENPDKHVDAKVLVGPKKERLDIKVAMSNSFGFASCRFLVHWLPAFELDHALEPLLLLSSSRTPEASYRHIVATTSNSTSLVVGLWLVFKQWSLGWMGPNLCNFSPSRRWCDKHTAVYLQQLIIVHQGRCVSSSSSLADIIQNSLKDTTFVKWQDLMLCGGSDGVIIPEGIAGFIACNNLSRRNSDPTKDSKPWDSDHDRFVMGEGAGVMLLEELEHAKRRRANIYAEFMGGSSITYMSPVLMRWVRWLAWRRL
ncbi:hypothetical protein CUMW_255470 [Citrus unshiu]|uniref:beta-ketoacyl-[acyl-carrier-protein] synthase I n=1 Tax=Citrus unshiu TaxID=55188 RepID=A0A2H5QRV4_CITUN|nr:hypothetical protein CUMW_255460 [Citrus unshiu]GAY67303.1 hypothetical protein CUMW_255470 [Citrus unshiu]